MHDAEKQKRPQGPFLSFKLSPLHYGMVPMSYPAVPLTERL